MDCHSVHAWQGVTAADTTMLYNYCTVYRSCTSLGVPNNCVLLEALCGYAAHHLLGGGTSMAYLHGILVLLLGDTVGDIVTHRLAIHHQLSMHCFRLGVRTLQMANLLSHASELASTSCLVSTGKLDVQLNKQLVDGNPPNQQWQAPVGNCARW